ncbi:MAG: Asp-tRNA(Asn)/Glu-tRNA(Gln) amidotransferase GatCAB subunit B, partial [Synechocystis sp.]
GSSDYRYFPEPDLPPLEVSEDQKQAWLATLPELPAAKRRRYEAEFGLSAYDAQVLTTDREVADYFEAAVVAGADAKLVSNWVTQDIAAYLNSNPTLTINDLALSSQALAELISLITQGTISGKIAKDILPELLEKGGSPKAIVESRGLIQLSDPEELTTIIKAVIADHPKELEKFRSGKGNMQGFFVGQVMKRTGGKADPKLTNQLIGKLLAAAQ